MDGQLRRLLAFILAVAVGSAHGQMLQAIVNSKAVVAGGSTATFDAVGNANCNSATCGTNATPASTLTYSVTVGSNSNRAFVVYVCLSGPSGTVQPSISGVTYASVSLSLYQHISGNYYCDIWKLADGTQPTTGANNVVVTMPSLIAADSVLSSGAISAYNVDQTTNLVAASYAASSGTGTSATLTLGSSNANDLVTTAVCSGSTGAQTQSFGTTRFSNAGDNHGACNVVSGATAVGATTAIAWTVVSDSWRTLGVAFKHA